MSKIKSASSAIFGGLLLLLLLCFPAAAKQGALSSLSLFAKTVLPSVLPCMTVNLCLIQAGAADTLSPLTKWFCRMFRLPEHLGGMLCLSLLSGAPTGARLLSEYDVPSDAALRFLTLIPCMSPLYCVSVLGSALGSPWTGLFLYGVQLISGFLLGFLYRAGGETPPLQSPPGVRVSLFHALPPALSAASLSAVTIGGSMALFGALRGILSAIQLEEAIHKVTLFFLPKAVLSPLLSGLMEVSIGCQSCLDAPISSSLRLSLLSGLCAFGGLSIVMQVTTFLPKVSVKSYLFQRFLHGALAFSLCRLLTLYPRFLVPVYAMQTLSPQTSPISLFAISVLFSFTVTAILLLRRHKKQG